MICGYRTTGKDHFYNCVASRDIRNWRIYSHKHSKLNLAGSYEKVSFADSLKASVGRKLGVSPNTEKTKMINGKTFRQHLIDMAKIERSRDPLVYCKQADYKEDAVITDWRYPNEFDYVKTIYKTVETIRVFRAKIPRIDVEGETTLDDFLTDFVAISQSKFDDLIESFPQYKDYTEVDVEF